MWHAMLKKTCLTHPEVRDWFRRLLPATSSVMTPLFNAASPFASEQLFLIILLISFSSSWNKLLPWLVPQQSAMGQFCNPSILLIHCRQNLCLQMRKGRDWFLDQNYKPNKAPGNVSTYILCQCHHWERFHVRHLYNQIGEIQRIGELQRNHSWNHQY